MRGLSLTRRRGENVVLHIQRDDAEDPMILGVITVQEIGRGSVRLRLACRPSIKISRYDEDVDLEDGNQEGSNHD